MHAKGVGRWDVMNRSTYVIHVYSISRELRCIAIRCYMLKMQTVSCACDFREMNLNLNLHDKNTDADSIQLNERCMKTKILLVRPK